MELNDEMTAKYFLKVVCLIVLRVPSNERSGLIKALIPEQKDTSVPPYVPQCGQIL
jgi:hypothetical protein